MGKSRSNPAGILLFSLIYITAGVGHLVFPSVYLRIMPPYLPAHRELVLLSGVAEIFGGLGILYPPSRRFAAWGVIALLIAVLPANLYMAQHPEIFPSIPQWALWLRLPLQLPLIAWAWRYTK